MVINILKAFLETITLLAILSVVGHYKPADVSELQFAILGLTLYQVILIKYIVGNKNETGNP